MEWRTTQVQSGGNPTRWRVCARAAGMRDSLDRQEIHRRDFLPLGMRPYCIIIPIIPSHIIFGMLRIILCISRR